VKRSVPYPKALVQNRKPVLQIGGSIDQHQLAVGPARLKPNRPGLTPKGGAVVRIEAAGIRCGCSYCPVSATKTLPLASTVKPNGALNKALVPAPLLVPGLWFGRR